MVVDQAHFSLARSCTSCVKAKRKCDLRLPRCERCVKKRKQCVYKNQPTSGLGYRSKDAGFPMPDARLPLVIRQENDLAESRAVFRRNVATDIEIPVGSQDSDSSSTSESNDPLCLLQLSDCGERMGVDLPTVYFLVEKFRELPGMFAEQGGTTFIHPVLHKRSVPVSLRLAQTAYSLVRKRQSAPLWGLETTFWNLVSTYRSITSFEENLALVQSLVLIQVMTIFQSQLSSDELVGAEARQSALDCLTHRLWKIAPAEVPQDLTPHAAYCFADSVRRTIHMASKLRCVFDFWTKGYFVHTMFQEALPLDRRSELWELKHSCLLDDAYQKRPQIVSYREFASMWDGGEITHGGVMETMLLVGARGKAAVDEAIRSRRFVSS